jgi:hypothetical protein
MRFVNFGLTEQFSNNKLKVVLQRRGELRYEREESCNTLDVERRGTGSLKWDSPGEIFGLGLAGIEFKTVPDLKRLLPKTG